MRPALLAAAWLSGTGLGLWFDVPTFPPLLLVFACALASILLRILGRSMLPGLLAAVLLLGLLRVEVFHSPTVPLNEGSSRTVKLTGKIVDDPTRLDRHIRFTLAVQALESGSPPMALTGKLLAYVDPLQTGAGAGEGLFRYGDTLRLQGTLEPPEPFDGFDYPAYLSSRGISGVLWVRGVEWLPADNAPPLGRVMGVVFAVRGKLSEGLDSSLTHPHSGLANALLLGRREGIPPEVAEDFRNTGAAHLLAISGLHVGIQLLLALAVAGWALGRRRGLYLLVPLLAVWMYVVLSGVPVSVVRAAIMGTVYLAALALGRPRSALPSLSLAAAVMVGVNPVVLGQISFQLSFTAIAGIVLALPFQARVSEALDTRSRSAAHWSRVLGWQAARWALPGIIVSAAATTATWPLVAYNFDHLPLFGIVTTLLALPALPFILIGSLATAIGSLVHPILGQFIGWLAWLPISYLLVLVENMPSITAPVSWVGVPLVWVWYGILGGLMLLYGSRLVPMGGGGSPSSSQGSDGRAGVAGLLVLLAALMAGGLFLWAQLLARPEVSGPGNLHVYFFDVGQGDSALIVTPTGRQVLIDGGPGRGTATRALAGRLPRGDRSLDLVVLTHLDDDHSRGLLRILERYSVGGLMVGEGVADGPDFASWQTALERHGVRRIDSARGLRMELEPGVTIEVLNPPQSPKDQGRVWPVQDRNNQSVALRMVHGRAAFLFAADIEAEAEDLLARGPAVLQSAVLKVSHHGSGTSTIQPFLDRVSPVTAIISSGEDNRFGHPDPDVVSRLEAAVGPERVYRTDRHGTVEVISDGESLWVKTDHSASSRASGENTRK